MNFLNVGKLPPDFLKKLFKKIDPKDTRVVVGPRVGEDAAVLDMGDHYLVAKTDPITFTEDRIGWYCVNVNANDIATMGAVPRWFLATLLLPEGKTDEPLVEKIFDDILDSCRQLDVSLCGGHAEITSGLTRPILIGQMLGEVSKDRLVIPEKIKPGDVILLTKGIAIEGTAILAAEKENVLKDKIDIATIRRAKAFLDDPGISIVKEALTVCQTADIHGLHDPTEGGIMTGLWELAQVSNLSLSINRESISIFPETTAVCDILGLDPLGLIASGALLIVIDPKDADKVISSLSDEDIPCRIIGEMLPAEKKSSMHDRAKRIPIKPFLRDEITKALS